MRFFLVALSVGISSVFPINQYLGFKGSTAFAQASENPSSKAILDVTGSLEEEDSTFSNGSHYDQYIFEGKAGDNISITLESLDFDTYLLLTDHEANALATNDDIESTVISNTTNSWIATTLPSDGKYIVVVISLQEWGIGQYRLRVNSGQTYPLLSDTALEQAEANRLLEQGLQEFRENKTDQAFMFWQNALDIYRIIADRIGEAQALGNLGIAHHNLGQYRQALDLYTQQLNIARTIGDRTGEGNALGNLGTLYKNLGEYQQAIELYQQRLAIANDINDLTGTVRVLNNLGQIYIDIGQYQQAITHFQQLLTIAREIHDSAGESSALGGLGQAYAGFSQYQRAIVFLRQQLTIARETGNRALESSALGNLGNVFFSLGQYYRAIDLHTQDLFISRDISDRDGEADALGNLGNVLLELGQYQQSIELLIQQHIITREINDLPGEGRVLGNLGNAYLRLSQYQQAIDFYEKSLAIVRKAGSREEEGQVLSYIGNYYLKLGQYQRAIDFYKEDLAITREVGNRNQEASTLSNIGVAYRRLGDYSSAINFYQMALEIAYEVNDLVVEGNTLTNLGHVLFLSDDFAAAENHLLSAVKVLESLRSRELSESQRISLIDLQLNTFQSLQKTLISRGKIFDALEIAERARARVFIQELASRSNIDLVTQDNNVTPVNIVQIQEIARNQKATLVQYSIIQNEDIYVWVVQSTGEVDFQQINLKDEAINLSEIVELTRNSIGVSRLVEWGNHQEAALSNSEQLNQKLQRLYQVLIDPIKELLPDDPDQSVIFIPQDELFLVPFAALQDSEGNYLIDQHTILTAPSIQVLDSTRKQQAKVQQVNLQENLVIGDPTMLPLSLVPGEPPISLDELSGAEQEAIDIAALLNTDPLLGDAATKSTIVQQMPNARIIHMATHGIFDEFQGLNGGVVLSADGTGEFNDGLLTAAEIAQMELNAELVVLSACNTGQGRITGDGVVGLSRSLILAGVPSVVVSLWAVPDQPTGALMTEFYQQLEQTDNKAIALRQAMLKVREKYPEPIAWAGFTLIGESK